MHSTYETLKLRQRMEEDERQGNDRRAPSLMAIVASSKAVRWAAGALLTAVAGVFYSEGVPPKASPAAAVYQPEASQEKVVDLRLGVLEAARAGADVRMDNFERLVGRMNDKLDILIQNDAKRQGREEAGQGGRR